MEERFAFAGEARGAVGHDAFALGCSDLAAEVGFAGFAELAFFAFGVAGGSVSPGKGMLRHQIRHTKGQRRYRRA